MEQVPYAPSVLRATFSIQEGSVGYFPRGQISGIMILIIECPACGCVRLSPAGNTAANMDQRSSARVLDSTRGGRTAVTIMQ